MHWRRSASPPTWSPRPFPPARMRGGSRLAEHVIASSDDIVDAREQLARLRVTGVHALSSDRAERAALEAAAERAGRRLVEATTPDSVATEVALGWAEGCEPV